jgi:hypothetical protein
VAPSGTSSAVETRVSTVEVETGEVRILGVIPGNREIILAGGTDSSLCWSADGSRIVFTATTLGRMQSHVHVVPADGSEAPQRLTTTPNVVNRSVSCPRGS